MDQHIAKMRNTLEKKFSTKLNDWDKFLGFFKLQKLEEGEHWVRAGEPCEEFFYISDGILRLYYVDQEGNEINEGFYEEGQLLGPISSFANGTPCPYFIQALEPAHLVVANYHQFHTYGEEDPALLRFEITFMHDLFVKTAKRDGKRLISSGEQRYKWFCREYPQFLDRVPQYHIASFLGMTPVSLSRLRKQIHSLHK